MLTVPGTVLSNSSANLVESSVFLVGRHCSKHLHGTGEETGSESFSNPPWVTQPGSGDAGVWSSRLNQQAAPPLVQGEMRARARPEVEKRVCLHIRVRGAERQSLVPLLLGDGPSHTGVGGTASWRVRVPKEGCLPRLEGPGQDQNSWGTESARSLPRDRQGAA